MGLILLNLQSNHEIFLDKNHPFVIGRGPLTGCADKRVSRSHGRITCTADGKIKLQALHSNPCFFTKNGTPPVRQLNKNEEQVLSEGDCLGLLPNSYWYQVISKSKAKGKKLNQSGVKSPQFVAPKAEAVIPKVEVIDLEENTGTSRPVKRSLSSENINNAPRNHDAATASCSRGNSNPCIPFRLRDTCRLPVWMYEVKGQRDLQQQDLQQLQIKREMYHVIANNSGTGSAPGSASNSTATNRTRTNNPDERRGHQDNSRDGADDTRPRPGRPYCRYDANCYRKNAQHKLEFSHPGDADYVPYGNRPMCEYGANCYRRSLSHRRQFRHGNIDDPQTSQAPEAPNGSNAPGDPAQGGTANARPRGNGDRQKRRHKRKRTTRSCHLSVTVSASPKQKRRRNGHAGSNQSTLYASDVSYDDSASSQDPFSDDFSSDDYLPSDDSGDDLDEFQYYSKDYYY